VVTVAFGYSERDGVGMIAGEKKEIYAYL